MAALHRIEAPEPIIDLVGDEGQPVIIQDNVLCDIEAVRRDAAGRRFMPVGPFYPGIRAAAPVDVVDAVIGKAQGVLRGAFGARRATVLTAYYSLVTADPATLALPQCFPHYDGVEPERIALLVYLGAGGFGGTAFYRHRATGFETITRDRLDPYLRTLGAEIAANGPPAPAYIDGDTALYQRIHTVSAQADRMLVYRGNLLHSANIPDSMLLSKDPTKGRLTLNIFLMAG